METNLSIDEVTRRTGLTAHTLRWYERIGLIAPVARAPGGGRRYAAADVAWIEFLQRLRATRMPVAAMQRYARLRHEGEATAGARRAMLEEHLAAVLAEIDSLQDAARTLELKIDYYRAMERGESTGAPPAFGQPAPRRRALKPRPPAAPLLSGD